MDPTKSSVPDAYNLMNKAINEQSTSQLRKALDAGAQPTIDDIYSVYQEYDRVDREYRKFVNAGGARYCDKAIQLVSSKQILKLLAKKIRPSELEGSEARKYEQILMILI